MNHKIKMCDRFAEKLESFRINSERHSLYHIQVQVQHNFYPFYQITLNERPNRSTGEH